MPHDDHEARRKEVEQLFGEHARPLYGLLLRLGAHVADAEDMLQKAFLITFDNWDRVRAYDDPAKYLRVVAVRLWRRLNERDGRRRTLEVAGGRDRVTTPDFAGCRVDTVDLMAALARLQPRPRAVIVLSYVEEFCDADIADVLAISVAQVRRYRKRARLDLQRLLGRDDERDGQ